jgi:pyruvate ferredoxin oxidoreductase gamma subunit
MTECKIIIHGRAGEGAKSAVHLIAESAMHEGKHMQAFPEYGAERGGAPMKAFARISDKPIKTHQPIQNPDVIIVINDTLLCHIITENTKGCILIVNTTRPPEEIRGFSGGFQGKIYTLDATSIALQHIGKNKPNTVLIGAFIKLTDAIKMETMEGMIRELFLKKLGEEKTNANIAALKEGADKVNK